MMEQSKKSIGARTKTPKKPVQKEEGWKLFLNILLMIVWTGASVIVAQFIIVIFFEIIFVIGNGGGIGDLLNPYGTDATVAAARTLNQPVWVAICSTLGYILAMFLIALPLIIWRKHKKETVNKAKVRNSLGLRDLPTWTDIGLAPVGFIVYVLLAAGLTGLFSIFPWFDSEQVQDVGFSFLSSGFDRIVAFVTLVVVAPIAEEILFRGWLYGKMRSQLLAKFSDRTSMIISIVLVSILFGFLHGQWNVGVNVFAMSIVLCGLREITGTIYSGILLHMLKNGIAFYLLFVLGVG